MLKQLFLLLSFPFQSSGANLASIASDWTETKSVVFGGVGRRCSDEDCEVILGGTGDEVMLAKDIML